MLRSSHRTQADAVAFRLPTFGPVAASGSGHFSQTSSLPQTCDLSLSRQSVFESFHFFKTPPVTLPRINPPMREMKLQDLKAKTPAELVAVRRRAPGRKRQHHAQAGADVRDPQAARHARDRHHRRRRRRSAVRRLRLSALAGIELPLRARRHLRLAQPDPPLRPAHRRHRRRPHPLAEGRRALFRAAQGQHDQFRGPREGAPQDQLRQPDAALSRRAAEDGTRGSDQEGPLGPRHRHRGADRQGPARADRVAAAHRQDRAAAEHRARHHRQSPRSAT